MKQTASFTPTSGHADVDDTTPTVDQLWHEVKGLIKAVDVWMRPFLKLLGVVKGDGLSPLVTVEYSIPVGLHAVVAKVFESSAKNPRDSSSYHSLSFETCSGGHENTEFTETKNQHHHQQQSTNSNVANVFDSSINMNMTCENTAGDFTTEGSEYTEMTLDELEPIFFSATDVNEQHYLQSRTCQKEHIMWISR